MIEPAIDGNGRLLWVSLVPPLDKVETEALFKALESYRGMPIVWSHGTPGVQFIQIAGRVEPDIEDEP